MLAYMASEHILSHSFIIHMKFLKIDDNRLYIIIHEKNSIFLLNKCH